MIVNRTLPLHSRFTTSHFLCLNFDAVVICYTVRLEHAKLFSTSWFYPPMTLEDLSRYQLNIKILCGITFPLCLKI